MDITRIEPLKMYIIRAIDSGNIIYKTLVGMGVARGVSVILLKRSGTDLIVRCGSTRIAMNDVVGQAVTV